MNRNKDSAEQQLNRLSDAMAKDIEAMSDEEILAEAKEIYGDADRMVAETRQIMEDAIAKAGKARLQTARAASRQQASRSPSNIVNLSFEKKRSILEQLAAKDRTRSEELTLAARSKAEPSADIDGLLEDLIELGLIDGDGNIL